MITIGFAGTAKNTGKTTTAVEVINSGFQAGLRCALTSIGYDGENIDNVTGLPKPRFFLPEGALFATAQECLRATTAGYKILQPTGIHTILGEVLVAEVQKPGFVLLAGPNRKKDMLVVLEHFRSLKADLALADGALNRLVPMSAADGLVLSTGAAMNSEIPEIARHASALRGMFSFPLVSAAPSPVITLSENGSQVVKLSSGSLLSAETFEKISSRLSSRTSQIIIPDACYPHWIEKMLQQYSGELAGKRLVFGSPLKLIASGSPVIWERVFTLCRELKVDVRYLETIPLLLFTVNPFYPRFIHSLYRYEPAFVDKVELLKAVQSSITDLPVVDIRQSPDLDLLSILSLARINSSLSKLVPTLNQEVFNESRSL